MRLQQKLPNARAALFLHFYVLLHGSAVRCPSRQDVLSVGLVWQAYNVATFKHIFLTRERSNATKSCVASSNTIKYDGYSTQAKQLLSRPISINYKNLYVYEMLP